MTTMVLLPPTPKQRAVEKFIARYIEEHDGISPSFAEIGAAFGISDAAAFDLVRGLINRGRATKAQHMTRSIRLVASENAA